VGDVLSPARVAEAGLFDGGAVAALLTKCRAAKENTPLSNADNMAFVGVLSTQLLWETFVNRAPDDGELPESALGTRVSRSAPV
jgi:asparagine synthase (glutamine-hydrolysing)